MERIKDWIYRPINTDQKTEETLKAVERALGFKLFIWQKTFITTGIFRQYGKTTAEVLRDLLAVDDEPLDYSKRPTNMRADLYRRETKDIKEKLEAAGIETRTVFFSRNEKNRYYKEKRERESNRLLKIEQQPKEIQPDILPKFRKGPLL